jgi:Lipocalin-like domain
MKTRLKRVPMKSPLLFFLLLATSTIAFAQNDANVGSAHRKPGARERLIGTWRLVSAGTFRSDGKFEPYPEYGPNPIGYLMYDTTGHMCVSLANPNHPHWANSEKPTDAEKLGSYDVFFAYCGGYEVLEKESRVIHRPEVGSWPHYIGTDQSRNFRLEGDRLILSDEETVLVQSEMEKKFFPLVKIPPQRGGDFRGIGIHRATSESRSCALAR